MIKVLFVDDEVLAMEYLQNLIDWEMYGFCVVGHARSGKKALEIYEKERPQLVICDIKMAGMDGLELTQKLKKHDRELEVILLSAYKDFEYAQKGFEYGVSNYLLKHELCHEKLLQELDKVRDRIEFAEKKKKIYQKYFMEQLIYNSENVDFVLSQKMGNRFFMILLHKNDSFSDGRFLNEEWTSEEWSILEETTQEPEEGIFYIADISLTGNNVLVLYGLGNLSSKYMISTKIEQKCRMIAAKLSAMEECQFNIIFSDEIRRDEISKMFQRMSGQIRYSVFWKHRCIYNINRLRENLEDERIAWNEHEEELRKILQDGESDAQSFIQYLFELVQLPEYHLSALRELIYMLENLCREYERKESIIAMKRDTGAYKLQDVCQEYMCRVERISQTMMENQQKQYSKPVYEMIRYIRQNYRKELNLELMGEQFHMNGVYLGQMFKKETGVTFLKYLTNIRIEKAKELLLQGKMNISQVAEAVGYRTSQYFSQIFIKTVGIKPQEYRKWNGKRMEEDN